MHHKTLTRLNRVTKQLQKEKPRVLVVNQGRGEPEAELNKRVELLHKEINRIYGQEGVIVTIRTFSEPEDNNAKP